MKVWITKYALTVGIEEIEAQAHFDIAPGFICEAGEEIRYPRNFHGEGREWHRTREAAILRARHMRSNKIHSLQQQIKKLEKMTFTDGPLGDR